MASAIHEPCDWLCATNTQALSIPQSTMMYSSSLSHRSHRRRGYMPPSSRSHLCLHHISPTLQSVSGIARLSIRGCGTRRKSYASNAGSIHHIPAHTPTQICILSAFVRALCHFVTYTPVLTQGCCTWSSNTSACLCAFLLSVSVCHTRCSRSYLPLSRDVFRDCVGEGQRIGLPVEINHFNAIT